MLTINNVTLLQDPAAESICQHILEHVCDTIMEFFNKDQVCALVLLGGYGRGEGGLIPHPVSGQLYPHNNFDLLLILNRHNNTDPRLEQSINQALQAIRHQADLGIDLSFTTVHKMKKSACRVIWYDMRHGHRTLLGDPDFVPSLTQHTLDNIPAWDVRNLLINRGALLLINRFLLAQSQPERYRSTVIKHTMKAIIGYGDALLFSRGRYHWSYAEKQQRMANEHAIDPKFKQLYLQAMSFRFTPSYSRFKDINLANWNETIITALQPIHLSCERKRLNKPELTWTSYLKSAADDAFWHSEDKFKNLVKRLWGLSTAGYPIIEGPSPWTYQALTQVEKLPLCFPYVLYRQEPLTEYSPDPITRHYLKNWQDFMDVNLGNLLDGYGLSLEDANI
ncbi:hypothetical protein [Shewanella violacea]|uniref:Uncharacterized protein n=1 Tax=Shewanella violacea (strain JCM 10179 / CIP 106290 / LMG 19151 / DSS12) TaxID=637905 RepID=D4ZIN8_SHEVD|nr:hypothetical protein [Shewanella violacea]BAJ01537.1 hypothetical protein SVI_1566 [Shewanella violacea DSS12]